MKKLSLKKVKITKIKKVLSKAIEAIDDIELVKELNRSTIMTLRHGVMYTTYKITGGVIYHIVGRTIILPDMSDVGYEVIISQRLNEFITDGNNELFDILSFPEL